MLLIVSRSFWLVISVAFIVFCIVSLGVMSISCFASDVLLSSYLIPYLHLPFLPMHTSPATRSLVGGHCLAYSCLGVFIQFCCFSPCLWLEVRSWPPSHHHGLRKNLPSLLSALSCFQDCGRATNNKNKYVNINIYIYIYMFVCWAATTPETGER